MSKHRRRRDRLTEDEREQQMTDGGISEYKYLPMVQPETDYPQLYSSNCIKCCPQSNSYIVDPVSATLGLIDIVQCPQSSWTGWLVSKIAGWCGYKVIASPGQCEVMKVAVKTGAVLLMTNHFIGDICNSVTPYILLVLVTQKVIPPGQIHYHPSREDNALEWIMQHIGVNVVKDEEILLDIVKKGGLVMTEHDKYKTILRKLMTVPSHGRELLIVPSHLSYNTLTEMRVDIGQPMSVREMIGAKGWDVEEVAQHHDVISFRLGKPTPSELAIFVIGSNYVPSDKTLATQEIISLLEARGAEIWHSKETFFATDKHLSKAVMDAMESPSKGYTGNLFQSYLESRLDRYFLADSVVAACIMSQLPRSFELYRLEDRSEEGGCLVSYDKIVERGILLVQLLGEDKLSLMPCQDLRQFVLEGVHRAEMAGALGSVTRPVQSQYGAEGGRQRSKSPWHGQDDYLWHDGDDSRPGVMVDTKMVVGHREEGRRWLVWMSGMIKHKIENLAYVLKYLFRSSNEKTIFTIQEILEDVNKIVIGSSSNDFPMILDESVTKNSVKALEELDIVKILPKKEVILVQVLSHELVKQFLKIVLEFKC